MSDREAGRIDLEKMQAIYRASRERAAQRPVITHRAVARLDQDLHMVGRVGRFQLESDEPAELGGEGTAPTALQYLVAGAAF